MRSFRGNQYPQSYTDCYSLLSHDPASPLFMCRSIAPGTYVTRTFPTSEAPICASYIGIPLVTFCNDGRLIFCTYGTLPWRGTNGTGAPLSTLADIWRRLALFLPDSLACNVGPTSRVNTNTNFKLMLENVRPSGAHWHDLSDFLCVKQNDAGRWAVVL